MKNLEYERAYWYGIENRHRRALFRTRKPYNVEIDTDRENHTPIENEAGKGFINHALRASLKIIKTTSDGKKEGFACRITGANGFLRDDVYNRTPRANEIFN